MEIKIFTTLKGILKKYRNNTENIDYQNLKNILKDNPDAILIDVRSKQEYNEEHLENSLNIPLFELGNKIEEIIPNKEKIIIVYCQSGMRSKKGIGILKQKGYLNVYQLEGGLDNIK